jgi:hypothetical protein
METVTNIHTFDQPIETSVKVGIEVDSKGQKKPSVEIRITRKIGKEQDGAFYQTVLDDLDLALIKCKATLTLAME